MTKMPSKVIAMYSIYNVKILTNNNQIRDSEKSHFNCHSATVIYGRLPLFSEQSVKKKKDNIVRTANRHSSLED